MDEQQSRRFESVCVEGGARFIGGLFACAALAEHELTGAETYYVITPTIPVALRTDFMTTGWFTGVVPITVPVAATSFAKPRCRAGFLRFGYAAGACAV